MFGSLVVLGTQFLESGLRMLLRGVLSDLGRALGSFEDCEGLL